MSFDIGINFRSTSGYVTDGANETYCNESDLYPTTRGGVTFGWVVAGGGEVQDRDRTTGQDRRLAGLNFAFNTSDPVFRLDLPATGTCDVHAAFGDHDNALPTDWLLKDNATTFQTISGSTSAANKFKDATGSEYTAAAWPGSETAVSRTFASTVFRLQSNSASLNCIAHLRIVSTSSVLAAGTLSVSSHTATSVTLAIATNTGGTVPYSNQLQVAPDVSGSPGSYSNTGSPVAGATASLPATGLSASTTYWFRVVVTDSAGSPATSTSNAVSQTTDAGTIAIAAPVANQWHRGGGSAITVTVSGTETPAGAVEYSTNGGSTWATLDASGAGGNYSGPVSLAASETDCTIQVRLASNHAVTASATGVANLQRVIALGGQSNEAGRGTTNQTPLPLFGSDASRMKPIGTYAALADPTGTDGSGAGSYAIHELNILGAALGHRLGLCNYAVGGTTLAQWQKGGGGSGYYEALAAAVTAVGGVDILRMGPCESDAIAGTSQATYHAGMVTFVASWLADFPGTKIVWRTLQHIDTGSATQPHQDAINAAIIQAAGSVNGLAGGDIASVYLGEVRSVPAFPGDTFHWKTDQQLADVGGILAAADYAALNPVSPTSGGLTTARGLNGGLP